MRFAISISQHAADGTFHPAAFRAYLARAEALGFESIWTLEQVLGSVPHMGPIETMTYAAACNERLRLGCAVRDLESVPVFGPPRACVDGLHEMIEAGAEMILLNPLFDEAEQMERLAADVMPRMLE